MGFSNAQIQNAPGVLSLQSSQLMQDLNLQFLSKYTSYSVEGTGTSIFPSYSAPTQKPVDPDKVNTGACEYKSSLISEYQFAGYMAGVFILKQNTEEKNKKFEHKTMSQHSPKAWNAGFGRAERFLAHDQGYQLPVEKVVLSF